MKNTDLSAEEEDLNLTPINNPGLNEPNSALQLLNAKTGHLSSNNHKLKLSAPVNIIDPNFKGKKLQLIFNGGQIFRQHLWKYYKTQQGSGDIYFTKA
tara:strand:+ start:125 stop:418 length:294 start_codon:yes stop_codon:yes gene_type:complete